MMALIKINIEKRVGFNILRVFLILFSTNVFSQIPEILWQKNYGGSSTDDARALKLTSDGGYIVGGYSSSNDVDVSGNHGLHDYWLLKIDSLGIIQWQKSFGGSNYDYCDDIAISADGGYIMVGGSTSVDGDVTGNHGSSDYWVIKIDALGNLEWQKSLGGSEYERAHSVSPTSDGGFIIAGESQSDDGDVSGHHGGLAVDFWIVKINSIGEIEWENSYGSIGQEDAHSIKETYEGGYIVIGYSDGSGGDVSGNHGGADYWIIKLANDGNLEWQNSLGGTETDIGKAIIQTSDGGYLAAGDSHSNNGDITGFNGGSDNWVAKITNEGILEWQKSFGGSQFESGFAIAENFSQEYLIVGTSESDDGDVSINHGGEDIWAIKIDTLSNIIWEKSFGGSLFEAVYSITMLPDSNSIITGWSRSEDHDLVANYGVDDYWIFVIGNCNTYFYADNDGDGFGDLLNDTLVCNLPIGYVSDSTDCDDANEFIFPTATDICNTIDDNCNGLIDEDALFTAWYLDNDVDGFGDILNDSISCFDLVGYVIDNTDCNDLNFEINPVAIEICNDIDDNCNFDVDEGLTINTFYVDTDADNFGDSDIFINSCLEIIAGYVYDSTDCDDANNLIYPGATEICDNLDNDCNGIIDDNLTYIHSFEDSDADNYGNIEVDSLSCEIPDGFVEDDSDCDDTNPLIYPGADEILNGLDDNCNQLTDEGLGIDGMVSNGIIIYPNPTDEKLYIQWNDTEQGTFHLINVTGEIIETFDKIFPITEIDVSKYAAGVYLFETGPESNYVVIKFVKE